MSYIPDYRGKDNEKFLSVEDKNFLTGYRVAMESLKAFFDNTNIYSFETVRGVDLPEVTKEFEEAFSDWAEMQEVECVCSLFDNADYLTEDNCETLVDHNREA